MSPDTATSRTILVVPLRRPDEEPLARYIVQAAHARAGAVLVLDVRAARGLEARLEPLIAEFASTAEGNAQELALLGRQVPGAGESAHDSLAEALETLAPPNELPFEVDLTLPSSLEDLPAVRGYLEHVQCELYPDADRFELMLLVDEICQNAIENSPSNQSLYEIRLECLDDRIRLDVSNTVDDPGQPQRIMNRRLRSFDDSGRYLGDRGRGLFLIARLADELEIRSSETGRITVSATRKVR